MSNTIIQLRHSYVTGNVPSSLANGEIAINTYDGKLFYRGGASNTIQTIERYEGPAGLNQEVQFNDSGILGADSGLTYNKTTDVLTVVGGAIVGGVNVAPQIQLSFTQANSAFIAANSAGVYANGAFAKANTQDAINLTQNNSITAAFAAANAATATDTTQNNSITAAFTRANNSLDANNGGTVTGTITATSFIITGSFGNIQGANVIYANTFVANTGGYFQFADGSIQYTANAGSGGSTANSFGQIVANGGTILATTSNDSLQIVGESGITVTSNISAKKVVVSVPAGFTFTTADYGFVTDSTDVIYDYGTL